MQEFNAIFIEEINKKSSELGPLLVKEFMHSECNARGIVNAVKKTIIERSKTLNNPI